MSKILTTTSSDTSVSHQPLSSPTLVLPTEVPKQVSVSALWVFSNPNSSWSPSYLSSWLVFSVFMVWSLPSSSSKKVSSLFYSVPATGYKANAAYAHLASGLCCGFSSLVFYVLTQGCRFSNRYRGWCRCESKRATRQDFRRNDFDIDFRRSLGIVWFNRITDSYFTRLKVKKNPNCWLINKFILLFHFLK